MTSGSSEAAIDRIVATCNGDLRGALKALLLVNEQLEVELAELYAVVTHGMPLDRAMGDWAHRAASSKRRGSCGSVGSGGIRIAAPLDYGQMSRPSTFSLRVFTSSGTFSR